MALGNARKLHRVCHVLFHKNTACRRDIDDFLQSDLALIHFPIAYSELQEYSLVSLVERRIEEAHARIKKHGKSWTYALPPYICASLRQDVHLEALRSDIRFYNLCVSRWRSQNLLDDVLRLRCTPDALRAMSNLQKVKMVYQCSLESQYEGTLAQRGHVNVWKALTSDIRSQQLALPDPWKACVEYFKSSLVVGAYYSLPQALFDRCFAREDRVFANAGDVVGIALAVVASLVRGVEGLGEDDPNKAGGQDRPCASGVQPFHENVY